MKIVFKIIILILVPHCAIGQDRDKYDLPVSDRLVHENLFTITVVDRKSDNYENISRVLKNRAEDLCNNRPYKVLQTSEGTLEHESIKPPPLTVYNEGVFKEFSLPFPKYKFTSEHISAFVICSPDSIQLKNTSTCYVDNTNAKYVSDFYYEAATKYFELEQYVSTLNCLERAIGMIHPNSKNSAEAVYMAGEMYESGIGTEISKEKALKLYKRAAALGSFSALQKISSLNNRED